MPLPDAIFVGGNGKEAPRLLEAAWKCLRPGGNLVVNNLAFAVPGGGQAATAGTLNLTNATLVVSNAITVGSGTGGGTLDAVDLGQKSGQLVAHGLLHGG